jgi:acyl carrier protein
VTEGIEAAIFAFIRGRFPDVELTADDDIFAAGFVNSLFAMELVMFIEKTFGFTIPNEELRLEHFRTVGAMGRLIERNTLVEQGTGSE